MIFFKVIITLPITNSVILSKNIYCNSKKCPLLINQWNSRQHKIHPLQVPVGRRGGPRARLQRDIRDGGGACTWFLHWVGEGRSTRSRRLLISRMSVTVTRWGGCQKIKNCCRCHMNMHAPRGPLLRGRCGPWTPSPRPGGMRLGTGRRDPPTSRLERGLNQGRECLNLQNISYFAVFGKMS